MKYSWLLFGIALVACKKEPVPVLKEDAAPASSSYTPLDEDEDAGLPPVTLGPNGSEKAVFALLRGEQPAARFPLVATDDGRPVDDGLRDELAPRHRGTVKLTSIDGAADAVVRRVFQAKMPRFLGCYQRGLARNPNLTGGVKLALNLTAEGKVSEATNAGSSLPDSLVVECLQARMQELELPKPDKPGSVTIALAMTAG